MEDHTLKQMGFSNEFIELTKNDFKEDYFQTFNSGLIGDSENPTRSLMADSEEPVDISCVSSK